MHLYFVCVCLGGGTCTSRHSGLNLLLRFGKMTKETGTYNPFTAKGELDLQSLSEIFHTIRTAHGTKWHTCCKPKHFKIQNCQMKPKGVNIQLKALDEYSTCSWYCFVLVLVLKRVYFLVIFYLIALMSPSRIEGSTNKGVFPAYNTGVWRLLTVWLPECLYSNEK